MVVRRRHRHHLLGADRGADGGEPRRVADRAGGDDRALALHQARDGGDRADAARVGERDVGALQVVGGQLVLARLRDQVVEGAEEVGEREPAGVADHRDHQRAAAVLALHVDGDAEVDGTRVEHVRLAVDLLERARHRRHLLGAGARDRVGDQVREGDAPAGRLELLAAAVERGDRDRAEGRGGRHGARLVHVAREHRAGALERLRLRGCGGRARAVGLRGQHVGLGDAPRGAASLELRGVDAERGGDAGGDRGDLHALGRGRGRRARLRPCRGRRLGSLGRRCAGAVGGRQPGDHLSDGHGVAGVGEDLGDLAGGGRGDLGVDLVGRDLDDRLVLLDRVAGLLGPLEDRALAHRLAHRRHLHIDGLAAAVGLGRLIGRRRSAAVLARGDLREHRADADRVALGDVQLDDGAGQRRGDLGIHLVGGDLDEDLVFRDLIPLLLVPLQDGALGNRVAHLRHGHFDRGVNRHQWL